MGRKVPLIKTTDGYVCIQSSYSCLSRIVHHVQAYVHILLTQSIYIHTAILVGFDIVRLIDAGTLHIMMCIVSHRQIAATASMRNEYL